MNDGNHTHSSTVLADEVEKDETVIPAEESIHPLLVWGFALASLALLLFCFTCIFLVVIRRRKRRNISPLSDSPQDDATVCEEEEGVEEGRGG